MQYGRNRLGFGSHRPIDIRPNRDVVSQNDTDISLEDQVLVQCASSI